MSIALNLLEGLDYFSEKKELTPAAEKVLDLISGAKVAKIEHVPNGKDGFFKVTLSAFDMDDDDFSALLKTGKFSGMFIQKGKVVVQIDEK